MAGSKWVSWFKTDADLSDEALAVQEELSRQWLDIANSDAFKREVLDWLETETDKPLPLAAGADAIVAATRHNTFKEIRRHFMVRTRQCEAIVKGVGNG